jgi:hypothetical protein
MSLRSDLREEEDDYDFNTFRRKSMTEDISDDDINTLHSSSKYEEDWKAGYNLWDL